MEHKLKNYDHLIGQIKGLSEKQLKAHFGLYAGYVKKINEIEEKLKGADLKAVNYSFGEFSELQRRRAVPYNGAYLHEMYFENLTGKSTQPSPELTAAIEAQFGSLKNWFENAKAGLMSAHGWVLLVNSRHEGVLRNNLIEEHHRGVFVEQDILIALDAWEHAYAIDYGTSKADYINLLETTIDWNVVNQRFKNAKHSH